MTLELARPQPQPVAPPVPPISVRDIWPQDAHAWVEEGKAVLVDVRTAEERKSIGYVPGSVHVAWQTGPHLLRNPTFLKELRSKVGSDAVILFICRSGKRSADAAAAAAKAGFGRIYNVLEGIEGDPDSSGARNTVNGWRFHGLPLSQ